MSLATRCPHCNTIFKVVQDQLKVSEGWVRCGRCQEVFSALEGLFDMDREPPPERSGVAPAVTNASSDPAPAAASSPPEQASPQPWTQPSPQAQPPYQPPHPHQPPERAPEPMAVTDFDLVLPYTPPTAPIPPSPTSEPEAASSIAAAATTALPVTAEADALDSRYLISTQDDGRAAARRQRSTRKPDFADARFPMDAMEDGLDIDSMMSSSSAPSTNWSVQADDITVTPAAVSTPPQSTGIDQGPSTLPSRFNEDFQPERHLPPPSQRKGKPGTRGRLPATPAPEFIKQAERKAIWRHPAMRVALSLVALALAGLLSLQAAHHWRNTLAAHYPPLTPWLAQWCELAQCKLSAPMQIEDLQVDNIALVKTSAEGDDTYRLTAIIRNRADIELAWPRLDLTLTDSNGTIVARRAFAADSAVAVRVSTSAPGMQALPDASGAPATASALTESVPATIPAASSTTLQWQIRAPDLRLTSYTAELFYP